MATAREWNIALGRFGPQYRLMGMAPDADRDIVKELMFHYDSTTNEEAKRVDEMSTRVLLYGAPLFEDERLLARRILLRSDRIYETILTLSNELGDN